MAADTSFLKPRLPAPVAELRLQATQAVGAQQHMLGSNLREVHTADGLLTLHMIWALAGLLSRLRVL